VGQLVVGRAVRQEGEEQRGVADRAERPPVVVALHGHHVNRGEAFNSRYQLSHSERLRCSGCWPTTARILNKLRTDSCGGRSAVSRAYRHNLNGSTLQAGALQMEIKDVTLR